MSASIGPVRAVAATTTAQRNATALPPGDYIATVQGSPCFFLQGISTVVVTSTTGDRRRDGDTWAFTVLNHWDGDQRRGFVSILTESTTATVRVEQVSSPTDGALVQPPAWA